MTNPNHNTPGAGEPDDDALVTAVLAIVDRLSELCAALGSTGVEPDGDAVWIGGQVQLVIDGQVTW